MMRLWKKILVSSALLVGVTMNAQAGLINYNLPNVNDYTASDSIIDWFSTPVITEEIDSFTLSLQWWRDQGWGNQKGRLYYSSGDSGWQDLGLLAGHQWRSDSVTIFSSSPDDFDFAPLKFGYVVGGGGGHSLHIRNASVSITTVPEPGTLAILGLGLAGLAVGRRRAKS